MMMAMSGSGAAGGRGSPTGSQAAFGTFMTEARLGDDEATVAARLKSEEEDFRAFKETVAGVTPYSQQTLMLRKRKQQRMIDDALATVKAEDRKSVV